MTQPQQSMSNFALTVVIVLAACGGIAALGLRDRRRSEAAAAAEATATATPPTATATAEAPAPVTEPPSLLTDPTAEPTTTIRGKIIFDENRQLVVTDEESAKELVLSPAQLEQRVVRFHRDEEARAYWLDLDDGSRVELDQAAAKTVAETLPSRFTYGAIRAGDPPPEMLGSDSPAPRTD